MEALNFCLPLDFSISELALAVLCGKTLGSADLQLLSLGAKRCLICFCRLASWAWRICSAFSGDGDASRKNLVTEVLRTLHRVAIWYRKTLLGQNCIVFFPGWSIQVLWKQIKCKPNNYYHLYVDGEQKLNGLPGLQDKTISGWGLESQSPVLSPAPSLYVITFLSRWM